MNNYTLKLDLRLLTILLAIALVGILAWTQPWRGTTSKTTEGISVTGEATITAQPDQFRFMPSYQKSAMTSEEAISEASKIGNEVVAELKELGVAADEISTDVSSYQAYGGTEPAIAPDRKPQPSGYTANYTVTATTKTREIAEKVQAYLATTPATSQVSPIKSFSKDMQKKLETEARTKAIADAKSKAEQSAKDLGVKIGRVISVSEINQTGGPILLYDKAGDMATTSTREATTPNFETSNQDLDFTISVTYSIR